MDLDRSNLATWPDAHTLDRVTHPKTHGSSRSCYIVAVPVSPVSAAWIRSIYEIVGKLDLIARFPVNLQIRLSALSIEEGVTKANAGGAHIARQGEGEPAVLACHMGNTILPSDVMCCDGREREGYFPEARVMAQMAKGTDTCLAQHRHVSRHFFIGVCTSLNLPPPAASQTGLPDAATTIPWGRLSQVNSPIFS
jgi:hypothetical protein